MKRALEDNASNASSRKMIRATGGIKPRGVHILERSGQKTGVIVRLDRTTQYSRGRSA
jgi:hypothetical protein